MTDGSALHDFHTREGEHEVTSPAPGRALGLLGHPFMDIVHPRCSQRDVPDVFHLSPEAVQVAFDREEDEGGDGAYDPASGTSRSQPVIVLP